MIIFLNHKEDNPTVLWINGGYWSLVILKTIKQSWSKTKEVKHHIHCKQTTIKVKSRIIKFQTELWVEHFKCYSVDSMHEQILLKTWAILLVVQNSPGKKSEHLKLNYFGINNLRKKDHFHKSTSSIPRGITRGSPNLR